MTATQTPAVGNRDQAAAWDGPEGAHWTEHEQQYDAVGRRLDPYLFAAANLAPGEQVLDVGCGCGRTTREAARRVAPGHVLGVDLSRRMLDRARERSEEEALTNVAFLQADVQVHPFEADAFDLVLSRYGAMFFTDPVAAFSSLHAALRPDGRVVLLTWAALEENPWLTVVREALAAGRSLPGPPSRGPGALGLSDPDAVQEVLGRSGFGDIRMRLVREPLWFGEHVDAAFRFLSDIGPSRGLLADLDREDRSRALGRLRTALEQCAAPDGVWLGSTSWLVSARRA